MMTELERLQKEYDEAHAAHLAAVHALSEAKRRLEAARLEASGLAGHVVVWDAPHGFDGKTIQRRVLIERTNGNGGYWGKNIRKDGRVGSTVQIYSWDVKKLRDLGPYEAKP